MNVFYVSGLASHPARWLFCGFAFFVLAGCATARSAEEREAPAGEETVEIGYGEVGEDHVVGSVNTLDPDEMGADRPRTIVEMLERQNPGVMVTELPGGAFSVRIRGAQSFRGGTEPLYVLDGMVIQSLIGINPMAIESITVLKDAGATAVYGSRGANGVILIKTIGGKN